MQNKNPGTWFKRSLERLSSKKHWLKHTLTARGEIVIDDGAAQALMQRGASLLSSGVVEVKGAFAKGDAVMVQAQCGNVLAKGISQYSATELQRIKGVKSGEINAILGYCPAEEMIHRDKLIVWGA